MPQIIQLSMFDNKCCLRCRLIKDLGEFSARRDQRDGKATWCKACVCAYHKEHYAANKERVDAHNRANYFKDVEKSRQQRREYYYQNREHYLAKFAEHRKANPKYFQQYGRAYYAKNKARLNAKAHAYHRANRQHISDHARQWRRANRAICNALFQRRRARLKGAPGSHTAAEWLALRDWFGSVCLCCGAQDDLTADHVVPLIKGGSNGIENLQPLCRSCNSVKHDKFVDYRDPDRLTVFLATLEN